MKRPRPTDDLPLYPVSLAFVVQLQRPGAGDARLSGRVEHVDSGRAGRFSGSTELAAFILDVALQADGRGVPSEPETAGSPSGAEDALTD